MRLRVLFLMVIFAALPAAAHAQGGFLDFMEQWSGPGPFNYGPSFSVRVGCQLNVKSKSKTDPLEKDRMFVWWLQHDVDDNRVPTATRSCASRGDKVQAFLDLRYTRGSMDDRHPLFVDKPGELQVDQSRGVNLSSNVLQALLMRQVIDPAFAIGFGGGLVWFDGKLLDQGTPIRAVVTPLAVDVAPLRLFFPHARWARALVLQFQESAFVGAVDARKFNSTSTSSYSSRTELFRTFNVNFDVIAPFIDK